MVKRETTKRGMRSQVGLVTGRRGGKKHNCWAENRTPKLGGGHGRPTTQGAGGDKGFRGWWRGPTIRGKRTFIRET